MHDDPYLAHARVVLARADQVQLVPVHDCDQLLAHILRALHGARLDEVLVAPGVAELVGLPALVHSQQREVVTFRLEELGSLLVSLHTPAPDRIKSNQVKNKPSTLPAA
jgi:hypothetical protein